jgi:hypothetical protein
MEEVEDILALCIFNWNARRDIVEELTMRFCDLELTEKKLRKTLQKLETGD